MQKISLFILFFLLPLIAIFNMPVKVWAATYSIPTSTTIVDGSSYCGGKPCRGGDKLIIRGGSRQGLLLQNFNGQGAYITVTNENANPNRPVVLDLGPKSGYAILSVSTCKWLDFRGNNDPDLEYGITVNNGVAGRSAAIHVYGESEYIKIGYTEVSFNGNTGIAGSGIRVQDASLSNSWIFDTFEIHHNYIHDAKYAGMYLGHNKPGVEDDPYTANFSVHHNTIKKSGAYGVTLKGMMGPGASLIYENLIDTAGYGRTDLDDSGKQGIGTHMHYNGSYLKIYNNTIMNTVGSGIRLGETYTDANHEVYNNKVLGCGTGNHTVFGNGISASLGVNAKVYDNVIIQPKRYGVFVKESADNVEVNNNLIGDAGLGDMHALYENDALKVGEGSLANTYYDDVQAFNFDVWTDDENYYNDDFSFDGDTVDLQIFAPNAKGLLAPKSLIAAVPGRN